MNVVSKLSTSILNNRIAEWAESYCTYPRLKVNTDKSKIMAVERKYSPECKPFCVNSNTQVWSEIWSYLPYRGIETIHLKLEICSWSSHYSVCSLACYGELGRSPAAVESRRQILLENYWLNQHNWDAPVLEAEAGRSNQNEQGQTNTAHLSYKHFIWLNPYVVYHSETLELSKQHTWLE